MDLNTLLTNANEGDINIRQPAEQQILAASQQDFPGFLNALSLELRNNDRSSKVRQMAGILMKNSICSNNPTTNDLYAKQWLALPENAKNEIKNNLLNTLPSPNFEARHTAAQVVSKIALVELPQGQWGTLIPMLLENIQQTNEQLKQTTLQTIGYICVEIKPSVMAAFSDRILTLIVHGMRDPNPDVKLAASNAMCNALEFVRNNFDKKPERDHIMRVIFETCMITENANVRKSGYENLVKIVTLYYDYIMEYMGDIFELTTKAIESDPDEGVVLQAIEFWTSLSEEEINLQDEDRSKDVMMKALQIFVPKILNTLTRQDEHNTDTWNVCMAGSTCLTYIAHNVGDQVLPFVIPYVKQHVLSTEWRFREASLVALGSVLEGPTDFHTFLQEVVPVILQHLKDQNEMVKDTACWTLGRICDHQIESVSDLLQPILGSLLEATKDPQAKVAAKACWGIHNVCQAFEYGPVGSVSTLGQIFPVLAQNLYLAALRKDADEESLRVNAYEALNSLISFSMAEDNLILEVLKFILNDFEKSFGMEVLNKDDVENKNQIQSLLCSTVHTIASTVKEKIRPDTERALYLLFNVFKTQNHIIYEEALMAIGSIIQAIEGDFKPFMDSFMPILTVNLRNVEMGAVTNISIGIVSDIARSLGKEFVPYAPAIIPLIIQDLTDTRVSSDAKPNAFSCIGDIALAIGSDIYQFLPVITPILESAAQVQDLEDKDYLNSLRDAIFQAYSGIIHGLKSGNMGDQFAQYISPVFNFIQLVYNEREYGSLEVLNGAIGMLGDLATILGEQIKMGLRTPMVRQLLDYGLTQDTTKEVAQWADEAIFK
ncbi:hypothetical protein SAMD00019534_063590 [Acytostelium subglobosum LB1]|uniref:hypothetical protein n=1 Tax=Acytostelium subglobosum LB1 TaxID=1410327 RepID=UPI0006448ED9|nr:hypothetical protein SAMD00019534_063590 [Acytostelium subglobosum LB1]GAM23184.1 hypothetical protein SAMD00019534_063590 [Acytostelium subglobosum LB1]|eukprot:XP_012753633.1 hypothetical protein SAMD00019534_063590 [Acytostelium subglobosum LB1]